MLPKKYSHVNLENKKSIFLEIGFIISLGLVFISLELNFSPREIFDTNLNEVFVMDEEMIPITKFKEPKPPEVPKKITSSDILNIVDDDVELELELEIVDSEFNEDDAINFIGNWNVEVEEEEVEQAVFIIVEEMPIFRPDICSTEAEGKLELMKFVANKVRYPVVAAENGITGRVYISFIVSKDGKAIDVDVVRGVHPTLDKEAIRVISTLPLFSPGKQRGKAVRVQYSVPINFVLQ